MDFFFFFSFLSRLSGFEIQYLYVRYNMIVTVILSFNPLSVTFIPSFLSFSLSPQFTLAVVLILPTSVPIRTAQLIDTS